MKMNHVFKLIEEKYETIELKELIDLEPVLKKLGWELIIISRNDEKGWSIKFIKEAKKVKKSGE